MPFGQLLWEKTITRKIYKITQAFLIDYTEMEVELRAYWEFSKNLIIHTRLL